MHRRITGLISITFASGVLALAAACTSTTAEPASSGSTKKDSGSSEKESPSADDTKKDSGASSGSPTDDKCSAETTGPTCADCCGYTDQTFAAADEAYDKCACDGPCKTQCGDYCTNPQAEPSEACITCLDADGTVNTCDPKAQAACEANADCKKVSACIESAGCDSKPFPDAGQ